MLQLVAHLLGDYVLQNHWMAQRKTSSLLVALLHAVLYGLPFLLLTRSLWALAVIALTHAVIDRWRLARYWCRFWGVGESGVVVQFIRDRTIDEGVFFDKERDVAPPFLGIWLLIIVDNTAHLAINWCALRWL